MNTSQLICILNCDTFLNRMDRDVLAADQLPKSLLRNYPFACIVNTDSSSKEGQHWVAYYFNLEGDGEFFDSLGKSPNA